MCIRNITWLFQVIAIPLIYISLDVSHCALVIHNDVHLHTAGEKINEFHHFPYLGDFMPEIQLPRFIMPFDLHRVICFPLGRTV